MSNYAYPYDPDGTNPDCIVQDEQHNLADFPNEWRCVIPNFAPFFRKDFELRHADTDELLYEGTDYYLTHYYELASETNKMPIFGGIMINDLDLAGKIVFKFYRTLGDKYNMPVRVITEHLQEVDLPNPRNLDWEDVMRYSQAVPAIDVPENIDEAIVEDVITGALDRVNKALKEVNDRSEIAYGSVHDALEALSDKIHAHDIDNHHTKPYAHSVTHAQLNALHKEAAAVDTLKAYGYSLAELLTIIRDYSINETNADALFKLIGDKIKGGLRLEGDTVIIENEAGDTHINLLNGDMNIVTTGELILQADSTVSKDNVAVELASGLNTLSVHSTVGYWNRAAKDGDHADKPSPNNAVAISPVKDWSRVNQSQAVIDLVDFSGGQAVFELVAEAQTDVYVDGVHIGGVTGTGQVQTIVGDVDAGWRNVTIISDSWVRCNIEQSSVSLAVTNENWWCHDTTDETFTPSNTFPRELLDRAVYNGHFLIHVGNVVDYMPPASEEDKVLHVLPSATVYLTGLGTKESPLTGYVYYPVASEVVQGIFKLSHSIYSSSKKLAASAKAIGDLHDLLTNYADSSITINDKPLTGNVVITATDIELGNVDNTAPADKPASDDFIAAVANKEEEVHTHVPADFGVMPTATEERFGIGKLGTVVSNEVDKVAPVALINAPYSQMEDQQNLVDEKMSSKPWDVTQFGGFSYLPVPVYGKYGGAGVYGESAVGIQEVDGTFVALRNGTGLAGPGVFYFYCKYDRNLKWIPTATTTEYRPSFIADDDAAELVIRGDHDTFRLRTKKGKVYFVLTRGTMDMSKHVGYEIEPASHGIAMSVTITSFIYKGKAYLCNTWLNNDTFGTALFAADITNQHLPISFVKQTLSYTNWKGEALTGSDVYFTNKSQSADANDKPVILRLDNNHWSGGQNVRHSTQNSMATRKDNLYRTMIFGQSYYSNSVGSTGHRLAVSCTIDLDALTAVSDNQKDFPQILKADGWEFQPDAIARSTPWPDSHPNNQTQASETNGVYFCARFYGTIYTPMLYQFVPNVEIFEYLNAGIENSYTMVNSTPFTGAYGSVAVSGPKQIGFLDNNRVFMNQGNGRPAMCEYDPNGSYNDLPGFGPTTNRKEIPLAKHKSLMDIPWDWSTNTGKGFILSPENNVTDSHVVGEDTAYPVRWDSSVWNILLGNLLNRDPVQAPATLVEHRPILYAFGDFNDGVLEGFVEYTRIEYADATLQSRVWWNSWYKVTVHMQGGTVTDVVIGDLIVKTYASGSATGMGQPINYGQSAKAILDDGNVVYFLNTSRQVGFVGNIAGRVGYVIYSPDGTLLKQVFWHAYSYRCDGHFWEPIMGIFAARHGHNAESVLALTHGRTLERTNDNIGDETLVLHSTQVAESWAIYFTEELQLYAEKKRYVAPITTIDIRDYANDNGWSDYRNQTFYIYVGVNGDAAEYSLKLTEEKDTSTVLLVGKGRTNNERIFELDVNNATRLGVIYELTKHKRAVKPHPNLGNPDRSSFGLDLIENKPIVHEIKLPTFEEVFNTWTRISHSGPNYPANAGELNTWSYDEANDAIQNTTNSSTLVGFVSPPEIEVGDYQFTTKVSSTSADDDWIGVILAYVEKDGIQHTLTVLASACDTRNDHLTIAYNWGQSHAGGKNIATFSIAAGSGKGHGWHNTPERTIDIRRVGNVFEINVSDYKGIANTAVSYKLDLDSDAALDVFKRPVRFGYCAQSQPYSTWKNVLRPDEDVSNMYASAELVNRVVEDQDEAMLIGEGVVAAGQVVPLPEGYTKYQVATFAYLDSVSNQSPINKLSVILNPGNMIAEVKIAQADGVLRTNPPGVYCRYSIFAIK